MGALHSSYVHVHMLFIYIQKLFLQTWSQFFFFVGINLVMESYKKSSWEEGSSKLNLWEELSMFPPISHLFPIPLPTPTPRRLSYSHCNSVTWIYISLALTDWNQSIICPTNTTQQSQPIIKESGSCFSQQMQVREQHQQKTWRTKLCASSSLFWFGHPKLACCCQLQKRVKPCCHCQIGWVL